ncbi:type 2 lanthipeptide synthetase LanM family protein [Mycobacterium genavense]|uniref:type 2 lanthipeptide synthetase LanM family protein n=1 Tax=Mycobacterium genavense TaxID=36812 RepID=UPI0006867E3D|nr:type 2 lanthipeptide synthetase LanM family protein [Mycobacterium genavense]
MRRLFDAKPVLLRLMASLTRQWIDASAELVRRLDADLPAIRHDLFGVDTCGEIASIGGGLSDPHNFGRSVRTIRFDDGSRVVYKPKGLTVDRAWYALIQRLNRSAPIDLQVPRVLARAGYGWTEFVDHTSCQEPQSFRRYFRRAGGWLALFHCFAGVDMHQENIIARGEHPVPIDLEMILQAADAPGGLDSDDGAGRAYQAATEKLSNSVQEIGMLPVYGKHSNTVFSIGGVTSNPAPRVKLMWTDINSDTMRPTKVADSGTISNLPHIEGRHARLGDHLDDFISGFNDYAMFLRRQRRDDLFDGFAGLTIRKVARPTRFYYMLLERLKDHRTMDDGAIWSAQADFAARLADWQQDYDPVWPLQRLERAAVVDLNVPHFTMTSVGHEIRDAAGTSIPVRGTSGLDRARARLRDLDSEEIAWQVEVIRQSTDSLRQKPREAEPNRLHGLVTTGEPSHEVFVAEADTVARTLFSHAHFEGPGAAWIGLDWLGDSEISQLIALGDDFYNGTCGIALFLAAHAAVAGSTSSRDLAIAALARLRETLRGRNPAQTARLLGLGGGLGLGSIVYSLAVIAALLDADDVLSDAHRAAKLIAPDVISADRQLDILAGSAGAALGLLRLYRQTGSSDALERATNCGRHLLAEPRVGPVGRRSWPAPGSGRPLNGMPRGAAGFAYALAVLASATGSDEFASVAEECIAFENASFDAERSNWPDTFSGSDTTWSGKWCRGAPGIGLARVAITKHTALRGQPIVTDIRRALVGVERAWPASTDTLCCGTLGSIEFLWEAADVLRRTDLRDTATQRLLAVAQTARSSGSYRCNGGISRFNLGLFRGIAGVGYTMLRRVDPSLPNVLIWE